MDQTFSENYNLSFDFKFDKDYHCDIVGEIPEPSKAVQDFVAKMDKVEVVCTETDPNNQTAGKTDLSGYVAFAETAPQIPSGMDNVRVKVMKVTGLELAESGKSQMYAMDDAAVAQMVSTTKDMCMATGSLQKDLLARQQKIEADEAARNALQAKVDQIKPEIDDLISKHPNLKSKEKELKTNISSAKSEESDNAKNNLAVFYQNMAAAMDINTKWATISAMSKGEYTKAFRAIVKASDTQTLDMSFFTDLVLGDVLVSELINKIDGLTKLIESSGKFSFASFFTL